MNIHKSQFSTVPDQQADNIDDVLRWKSGAEVKYHKELGYYTDKEKPMGSLGATSLHVLTRSSSDRTAHRDAITQMTSELSTGNPDAGREFSKRFALRKMLGQPVTVDALDHFISARVKPKGSLTGAMEDFSRGIYNATTPPRRRIGSTGDDHIGADEKGYQ